MADRPTQSTSGPAHQPREVSCLEAQEIAAMNAVSAFRHRGLVLRVRNTWAMQAEEPFREPPYWLFDPGE